MKKILVLAFVPCFFCSTGLAQDKKLYTLKGHVTDSLSGPLEFSTVSIQNKEAGLEKKMLTDKNGNFVFEKLPAGNYVVTMEAAGFGSKNMEAGLKDSLQNSVDLGNIVLLQKIRQMNEVTVVARKPLLTQEIDRIVYHVQEDPDSKILNMLDMMRKLPFISLTSEDQIQFKGNTNFKVLLDGRSSSILSLKNLRDVLKGIPASNIQHIEVITVPSAKYESEGLAGIINIITNKKLKDGYSGSVNTSHSRLFSAVGSSFNLKKGKFGLSAFAGSSWERIPLSPTQLSLFQHDPVSYALYQTGNRRYNGNQDYVNSLFSFEFDSLNLLTGSIGISGGSSQQKNNQVTQLFDEAGSIEQSYSLYTSKRNHDNGWDAGLNYQRGFKKSKSQLLTLSYKYLSNRSDFSNTNDADSKLNSFIEDFRQQDESGLHEQSVQLDYVHPVKKLTIEGGSKFIYRSKFSNFFQEEFNASTSAFETDPGKADRFNYDQSIFGFYNSYLLKIKNWAVRGGFRVEATSIDADFQSTHTVLRRKYVNVLPSFTFMYRFKNTATVTAGYTQRIQRPGISLLNPFIDRSDPKFLRTGNPDLLAVRAHNLIFNFSRFKKSSVNIGSTYSFSRNSIQGIASIQPADSTILTSYQNIGKYDNIGINVSLTFPFSKTISLTANGNINYVWIKGVLNNEAAKNQGTEGFIYSYLSYRASKNWRFSFNSGFYGPVRNLQGNSNAYFYSSIGASKQIFKEKASLSLSVSNPFKKFRNVITRINTPAFEQQIINKNYFRNINLGFSYRFGKLKEEIKRNKRSINNDDKVTEVGKSQ